MSSINSVRNSQVLYFSKKSKKKWREIFGPELPFIHITVV